MSDITPRGNTYLLGASINSALDDSDLNPIEFRVYAHLCRRANDELRAWGSQKDIAKHCKVSVDSVGRALKALEDKGYLEQEPRFRDDGSRTSNGIILLGLPTPPTRTNTPTPPLKPRGDTAHSGGAYRSNLEHEVIPSEVNPEEVVEEDGAKKLEAESFGADALDASETFPENLNLEPETVSSADALNGSNTSSLFQETQFQKIEVSQKSPLGEKNLSGGAGRPEGAVLPKTAAGPVHKSGDKSKKAAPVSLDPLEKAKKQARGMLNAALGVRIAGECFAELARVDRQLWLEIPLERLSQLRKAALEQTEVNPKTALIHALDAEVCPPGTELARASPPARAGRTRPEKPNYTDDSRYAEWK